MRMINICWVLLAARPGIRIAQLMIKAEQVTIFRRVSHFPVKGFYFCWYTRTQSTCMDCGKWVKL